MITETLPDPFSLAQIVGYVAMFIGVTALLQHNDNRMRFFIGVMGAIVTVHFIMLGAYVGAVGAFFACSRAFLSILGSVREKAHYFAAGYTIPTLILTALVYQSPVDVLPLLASFIGIYGFFYLEGIKMRKTLMIGSFLWLLHNVLVYSYGPAMMEAIFMATNAYTIWRMQKAKQV